MSYVRHDKDNNVVSPQPTSSEVTIYDGSEGWSTITYDDWNADYIARNSNNTSRTPGTYQARNSDNTARTPGTYQRHDKDNDPISA
jgi:hypothetical protein